VFLRWYRRLSLRHAPRPRPEGRSRRGERSEAIPSTKNVGATGRSPLLRRLSPSCLCVARRQAHNDDESVPPPPFLGSYAPHGTNAPPLPPPIDLIKKVVQKCVCPFVIIFSLTGLFNPYFWLTVQQSF
jgi:hypothetical protein